MSGKGFIPGSNYEFDLWQKKFITEVTNDKGGWDLTADAETEFKRLAVDPNNKKQRWEDAWAIVGSKSFTHGDEAEMLEARKSYESGRKEDPSDTSLRLFITRYIRNNPKVTSKQKVDMGITLPDEVPSTPEVAVVKAKGNELSSKIKKSEHLLHIIGVNMPAEFSKALGKGMKEIQVFLAITEASVKVAPDVSAFVQVGTTKRGRFHSFFDSDKEGKRAWYFVRVLVKGKNPAYSSPSPIIDAVVW